MPPAPRQVVADSHRPRGTMPVNHGDLDAEYRRELLLAHDAVSGALREVGAAADIAVGPALEALLDEEYAYFQREAELRDAYRETLVALPLARCPFTSEILYHSV